MNFHYVEVSDDTYLQTFLIYFFKKNPNLSQRYPQENPIILCTRYKKTQDIVLKALIVVPN
ncbi:MAG: hypothetical protein CMC86_05775 [Flavobacteriaceae bacterium]|nr:hypothetical protein [Flavobacteriaceae bacterium]